METIKTACMVIVLMAIGYGVYTVLNQPEEVPPEVASAASNMELSLPEFPQVGMPGDSANSLGTPSSGPPPFNANSLSASPSFASAQSTAPQLGQPNDSALPSAHTAPPLAGDHSAEQEATPYVPQFAGASDLPPLGNTATANPAGLAPSGEAHIPSSPDATHTQLASVYSHGSSLGGMNRNMPEMPGHSMAASSPPPGDFQTDWDEAEVYLNQNDLVEACRRLTPWRNRPELTPAQKDELNLLLNQLGGTIAYSTRHLLEEPYTVGSGETLESIAKQYDVPPLLLQRINGLSDPNQLTPGQKLKVLQGPFSAKIDMTHNELSLEVDGCYAGRFPITIENGAVIPTGEHEVLRKEASPQFFDQTSQRVLSAGDPANPYGSHAIHLDGGVVLHGTGGPGGSISVSTADSEYLYEILSVGSKVTVLR
ncbi:LysM peptidoglycan-binding domain-containing protein [Bremerella cremea]|uniref:LysM peptidoglycan-binding domain-containing protein n=1 Tax=Bremerella cremea TaxID=1031537 RepID=A0A368KTG1_9BACT|nr:LysM peptidoglycan-binding domain-containing protein [Bremerella cremea]RCS52916.1 LysM peptidoglycan-binding domain-containing protein [Bremerella cremea]